MHLYFAIRGNKMWQDQFIKELEGKFLPIKLKVDKDGKPDNNGKESDMFVQIGVRPVQLFEIAFPKEQKDVVLNTILGQQAIRPQYKSWEKYLKVLRKIIGLKPIPEYDKTKFMPITKQNLDILGLGIKEDEMFLWGEGI